MSRLITQAAKSDFGAGVAIALLSLTSALSYGALLFTSPLLIPYIGYSISAALVTTIITVVAVAYLSKIKFSVAGPEPNSVAVLTSLIFLISQSLSAQGLNGEALAFATLTTMVSVTLITGIVLFLLGRFHIGSFIRFVPVSVAGGFLAAAGCLMVSGAVLLATGLSPLEFLAIGEVSGLQWGKLVAVIGLGAIYWMLTAYVQSSMALPLAIFASALAIHGYLQLEGISLEAAQQAGLLIQVSGDAELFLPLAEGVFDAKLVGTLAAFTPEIIATILVVALAALLIIAGIELDKNFDSDLNHELKIHGYAIGLSGIFGGFMGTVTLSRSLLNAEKKSRFPVAASLTVLVCVAVFIGGSDIITVLPQISLAAMVLFLGAQIAFRWMVQTFFTLDRFEYVLILLIAFTILAFGFIFGLVLGVVAGCILFAARASFVSVIRQELSGEAYRSRVVRAPEEEQFLAEMRQSIRIYELQGFLFFGTAYNFYTKVKTELETESSEIDHMILSFKHVSGVDASAEQILQKIFLAADKHNVTVSSIEMPANEQVKVARLLRRSPALIGDNNYAAIYDAMEAIEENLLRAREFADGGSSLQSWFAARLDSQEMAAHILDNLQAETFSDGDVICRQGDPADAIYFLDTGRIDVVSHDAPGEPFRIYSYMRHTMLGEMGFVQQSTRSADLIARGPARVFSLNRDVYNRLKQADDPLIDALLQLIATTLSDRIVSANRTIAELQA